MLRQGMAWWVLDLFFTANKQIDWFILRDKMCGVLGFSIFADSSKLWQRNAAYFPACCGCARIRFCSTSSVHAGNINIFSRAACRYMRKHAQILPWQGNNRPLGDSQRDKIQLLNSDQCVSRARRYSFSPLLSSCLQSSECTFPTCLLPWPSSLSPFL